MSTTTSPVVGKMGRGLSFDGSTQYVVNAQTVNTARVTMSIWFKKSGNPASQAWIAGFQDGLNGPSWDKDFYLATNGTVRWYVFDGSSKAVDGTTVVTDGKWHHIVGTADGTNAVLYIDGVQDGTFPVGATYTGYTVPDIFVGGTNNSGIALSQTVDEFKVYNRALSATEVARLYATRAAKQSASLPTLIPNGLVGYWTMDGKDINWATGRVADKSGTGNTAMAVSLSTTTSPVFGKVGQGLDLNGSNYLIVNSASSLNFGASTPFTMSAWIKMDPSGGSATESIMYKGDTGQNALYLFEYDISTRKLRAGVATQYTNNGCTIAGSTDVRDGKWHYVTAVYNRNASCTTNDILIYVDGVQESGSVVYSAQNADLNVSSNDSFRIGSQHEGSDTHFFDGVIDEARVYNRALSTAEVKQLYTAGVGSKSGVVPANKFASGGLVGYWSMNGKEADSENNLQYFGARYYDNRVGKFTGIDPYNLNVDKLTKILSDPQKLHSYLYSSPDNQRFSSPQFRVILAVS
jgi:RHS repeat-associated protein